MHCKQKFKAYCDPGHAWVAVKREILKKLGIENKVTRFSYERGKTVYLEEDCDLTTFVEAYKAATGMPPNFTPSKYSERSPIRSYRPFIPETVAPGPHVH